MQVLYTLEVGDRDNIFRKTSFLYKIIRIIVVENYIFLLTFRDEVGDNLYFLIVPVIF